MMSNVPMLIGGFSSASALRPQSPNAASARATKSAAAISASARSTSSGDKRSLAPGATTIEFSAAPSTQISATPDGTVASRVTWRTSNRSAR